MKTTTTFLAAALLAASTALYAQGTPAPSAPSGDQRHAHKRLDCSQAKDTKACEERHSKRKEMMKARHEKRNAAFDKGYEACKGKATGAEFRACMREQHPRARS